MGSCRGELPFLPACDLRHARKCHWRFDTSFTFASLCLRPFLPNRSAEYFLQTMPTVGSGRVRYLQLLSREAYGNSKFRVLGVCDREMEKRFTFSFRIYIKRNTAVGSFVNGAPDPPITSARDVRSFRFYCFRLVGVCFSSFVPFLR